MCETLFGHLVIEISYKYAASETVAFSSPSAQMKWPFRPDAKPLILLLKQTGQGGLKVAALACTYAACIAGERRRLPS